MFLKNLNLTNFRNYSQLELKFDNRPTIFIGNNAEGKSNILESIYLLSTSKSLRAEKEIELIKEGEQFGKIEGIISDESSNGVEEELLILINKETEEFSKKKLMVNGIARRAVDFIGNLPAVYFYPSDINMITGSPSLRRWHLDLSLTQIDIDYKKSLTLYEHFLTARNRVLKAIREGRGRVDELSYWTDGLLEQAKIVSKKRADFFNFINNFEQILGNFKFIYLPNIISLDKLTETQDREIAAATTLIGPHRDDFDMMLDHKNLAHFGSRGEQRMATLAFKLLTLEYMSKVLGKRPILLLDEIFSELDPSHRSIVASIAKKQQTIIATVELENIPQEFLDSARILKVESGKIISN